MSLLRQFFSANRKAAAYNSNVTMAPPHNQPGHDSERQPDETESSLSDTLDYIYYRMYAEGKAIPSKTPAAPCNPFLGRIKATSVPPPHTVKAVRCSIAKVEDIEDPTKTSLFLTPYSQSPMRDTDKVTILNRNGLGSTPHEPLAFVSDSERLGSVLESQVADTTPLEIRYLYYRMYAEDGAIPSKTPAAPGNPFVGRINATSVPPPHTVKTVRCSIAKVEDINDFSKTSLYLTPYSQSPMRDTDKVIILNRNGLGSTPHEPLAFVASISNSQGSGLESEVAEEPDTTTTPLEIRYLYYRMYAEDGAIPSKTLAAPGNPFLGRIKATSVPPPHTVKTVRCSIAKKENIKDPTNTSLFLTPYSQSPMSDTEKVILNRGKGLGSTPHEPLAFLASSERSTLESEVADTSTTPREVRYLYYLLYANDYEKPSKVAFDPEKPSLGRIRADSVAPPHSPTTIKRCISRAERTPAFAHADIFLDILSHTPLKEGPISILRTDCPALSPEKPMAIALDPSLQDGSYYIKNRAADIYWYADSDRQSMQVYFREPIFKFLNKTNFSIQWHITRDANGNITMKSCAAGLDDWWIGVDSGTQEIIISKVPIPWRLIRVDSKFYYLTTNVNYVSSGSGPRVATAKSGFDNGLMATLKEGDQWQMWEFIQIRK